MATSPAASSRLDAYLDRLGVAVGHATRAPPVHASLRRARFLGRRGRDRGRPRRGSFGPRAARACRGLDHRRHVFPEEGRPLGRRGAPVQRDPREDGQLSGRGHALVGQRHHERALRGEACFGRRSPPLGSRTRLAFRGTSPSGLRERPLCRPSDDSVDADDRPPAYVAILATGRYRSRSSPRTWHQPDGRRSRHARGRRGPCARDSRRRAFAWRIATNIARNRTLKSGS